MDDEMDEEEEEDSVAMLITPLPNTKCRPESDRLGGMTLDELLLCSVYTDLYRKAKDSLIDSGSRSSAEGLVLVWIQAIQLVSIATSEANCERASSIHS
jgi:hypothetical protein